MISMRFSEWLNIRYYHGSFDKLPIGTILTPRSNYEQNWAHNNFYRVLEKYRPPTMIAHRNAVFMCDNLDDIDNSGSPLKYVYEVQPLGVVQKHDMNWSSEIDYLSDQKAPEEKLREAAINYWNGQPHFNESVWEYLTPKAKIVALVQEE